jgi:hypothetical protein
MTFERNYKITRNGYNLTPMGLEGDEFHRAEIEPDFLKKFSRRSLALALQKQDQKPNQKR